jgi:hypothetical protein
MSTTETVGTAVMTPISGSRSGLAADLPPRLLDEEFGAGAVVRFEDVDFPAVLTHEPTRRFLRETGLPEDGILFQLDMDLPLPTLAEYYANEYAEGVLHAQLPSSANYLIRLGQLTREGSLVVDGATGAILTWDEPEATLLPLTADVSTLALSLWELHRERRTRTAGATCTPGSCHAPAIDR